MDPGLSIVLLGHTGVGKSASGNTILGRPAFDSRQDFRSVTTQISEATETVFGKQISVIDTPGIFGSEREIERWCQELLLSSRPCLFLVVFSVGRFTREQGKVLMAVSRVLGPQMLNKCHLLFTGGDALKGRSLEDFICEDKETKPHVTTFSGKYHLFNNENGGPEQVRELLMKAGYLSPEQPPDSSANAIRERRVVLLGLPGGGRSSSGNTILGSEGFKSDSVSTESVSQSAIVEGCKVTVVDTPGFTDKVLTPQQLYLEIRKMIITASPGPHAFVIVVRIRTITNADVQLFELLPQLFTSEALKYCMVLFTHGDELKDQSMEDLIQVNPHVSQLVSLCGGRYCVFDNRANRKREQVRTFLTKVDEMVTANGGQHFTNDMFKMGETFLREEQNGFFKRVRNLFSKKEKNQRAGDGVVNKAAWKTRAAAAVRTGAAAVRTGAAAVETGAAAVVGTGIGAGAGVGAGAVGVLAALGERAIKKSMKQ